VSLETLPSYKQDIKGRSGFSTMYKKAMSHSGVIRGQKEKNFLKVTGQECRLNTGLLVSKYGTKLNIPANFSSTGESTRTS